jgi:hypothetical protein
MKTTLPRLLAVLSAAATLHAASVCAQAILTDDFTVSANVNDPNFDINDGRQSGSAAVSPYALYQSFDWNHQVGNNTDVGQPGGTANGNYMLLALAGAVQNNLNLSTTATGPLAITFDLYNRRWGHAGDWGAFTLQAAGTYPFPIVGANEFGILSRNTGGIQVFDGGGNITPGGWDTAGFAMSTHWTFIFADSAGTGSAFNGNGSTVTILNGVRTVGTLVLNQLNTSNIELGFRAEDNGDGGNLPLIGIDNLVVAPSLPPNALPAVLQDISPASVVVAVGSNLVLTAAFSNSPPATLQWQQIISGSPNVTNNVNTGVSTVTNSGVVTTSLTLSGAQLAAAGSYRVKAVNSTNSAAVAHTSLSAVTVVPTITWYAAGTYNGSFSYNSVLTLAGPATNEVYGVDFGGSGQLTTANGYSFDDYQSTGNMSVNGTVSVYGGYESGATTGDGDFDVILNNGVFGTADNTGMLNNLTVGQAYTVMVLLDDSRATPDGSTFHVTDGVTTSPDQRYSFVNGIPSVGGYIMGTFTAQATSQPLTVLLNNNRSQYNAILLMKGAAPTPNNPPTFTSNISPVISEVAAGTPVTLSVTVAGSTPLHYQWANQGGPISGQTTASYTFNATAGTNHFTVVVTNAYGAITSSVATVISATNIVTVANFSFEADVAAPGTALPNVPSGWAAFNRAGSGDIGSQNAGGADYTVNNPLAGPAQGNQFCFINMFNPSVTGGIYYHVGALKTNTEYTLTVAIGSRADRINSPGIIALVRGTDDTGTTLVSGGGLPATQDTWQDYSVSFTNGPSAGELTIVLSVIGNGATIQADFDNVRLTAEPAAVMPPATINNPSFEADAVPAGGVASFVPTAWTAFNQGGAGDIGSQHAGGFEYTVYNPLAPPAESNQFCYINMFTTGVTGGIYQRYGALQPNTVYTLTVAIGSRADRYNSPGIISLINGTDNTGTVLASGGGLPAAQDTWEDFTAGYTTGPSVSGDLTVELSVAGAGSIQANFDNVRLTATPAAPVLRFAPPKLVAGNLVLQVTGGAANGPYTLLTTTNLTAPIQWTTNSTGLFDNSGAFTTSIPTSSAPAGFYRVRVP